MKRKYPIWYLFVLLAVGLQACSSIPRDFPRTFSYAYPYDDSPQSMLGLKLSQELESRSGQSAILPLAEGIDALAARLEMANAAQTSLDVQYYIWRGDTTGIAVAHVLLRAADRGVRVRLLLDDLQASVHDPALLALDQHPKIEVRMFNPSAARTFKAFELMSRFDKLNRRMHNKSFIADNQMAIVGGRNIGDEYFNASPEVDFSDFDVLLAGPVVPEVSASFDLYWNVELAIPISVLYDGNASEYTLDDVRQYLARGWQKILESEYARAVKQSHFRQMIEKDEIRFYWGKAQAVADGPRKILQDTDDKTGHLGPKLTPILETVDSELLIVSPYFVPGDKLVTYFTDLVEKGVRVTILTNSLASNDVGLVHAGYAKYREALLRAGIELYEYKPDPAKKKGKGSGITGSSRASLHAKVYIIDQNQLFVGSLNLDPRSFHLNSELGVVLDSPDLARAVTREVNTGLAASAYRVSLVAPENDDDIGDSLRWKTLENGEWITFDAEPGVGIFKKLGIWFLSLFVPEQLL